MSSDSEIESPISDGSGEDELPLAYAKFNDASAQFVSTWEEIENQQHKLGLHHSVPILLPPLRRAQEALKVILLSLENNTEILPEDRLWVDNEDDEEFGLDGMTFWEIEGVAALMRNFTDACYEQGNDTLGPRAYALSLVSKRLLEDFGRRCESPFKLDGIVRNLLNDLADAWETESISGNPQFRRSFSLDDKNHRTVACLVTTLESLVEMNSVSLGVENLKESRCWDFPETDEDMGVVDVEDIILQINCSIRSLHEDFTSQVAGHEQYTATIQKLSLGLSDLLECMNFVRQEIVPV